jgi:hypothetical protein
MHVVLFLIITVVLWCSGSKEVEWLAWKVSQDIYYKAPCIVIENHDPDD